jgi:putative endopeptidase
MTDETKHKAIEKLEHMNIKVAYPDKFLDYTDLDISSDKTLFENIMSCNYFNFLDSIKHIYDKVDITQWWMNPHEVNAYYSPNANEIVFPAGILQEPLFSKNMAYSFGGIGCIIGHEIIHGFDDMGRLYDMNGNLNNWWTDTDTQHYNKR